MSAGLAAVLIRELSNNSLLQLIHLVEKPREHVEHVRSVLEALLRDQL